MYDVIIFTDITSLHYVGRAIGAYKCAYSLRQAGYECLVVDHLSGFTPAELDTMLTKVITDRTLFVGVSTTFMMSIDTPSQYKRLSNSVVPQGRETEDSMVELIRQLNPRCKIVTGGNLPHAIQNGSGIDYSVIGYAEASIVSLANHLRHGDKMPGSYRSLSGTIIVDDRTGSNHDFVNSPFKWGEHDVANMKVLPIEIARGCIFRCKFCSYPMNGKQNLDFIRPADILYEEMLTNYYTFGVTDYLLLDDTFNDNEPKLDIMLSVVKRLPFQPKFWCYARLDLIARNPATLEKLYDIGLRAMYFGIETLNRKTGLIIGKGYDRSKQIAMISNIRHKYGNSLSLHGSFIIGLPEEAVESVEKTYNDIMNETIPLHTVVFNGLGIARAERNPFPSDLEKNYLKYGYAEDMTAQSPTFINWKSKHMTYDIAKQMAADYMSVVAQNPRFYISGHLGFGLKNLGYSEEYVQNTTADTVNWDIISDEKCTFVQQYKKILFGRLGIDI